ncbi:MAG: SEC-C metal-binding domain-containing protein [Clostridia bacterium]
MILLVYIVFYSIDNTEIKSSCGSGKKYKNCCGRNK